MEESSNPDNDDLASSAASKKKNKKLRKILLEVCDTCRQVLLNKDFNHHVQSHGVEKKFPSMADDQENQQPLHISKK
jgi:PAB1-binding protein PBP1